MRCRIGMILTALAVLLAGTPAMAGPTIREYEDAIIVAEGDRSAIRLSFGTDAASGYRRVAVTDLFDPYGDAYLGQDRAAGSYAIDWGVERCTVGGRSLGPYIGDSPHRTFERWSRGSESEDRVELELQRAWLDPQGTQAILLESTLLTIHAQQYYRRSIDIRVRLVNVGEEPVSIPADAAFEVRIDMNRPQSGYRTPENEFKKGSFRYSGPWLSGSSMSLTKMKTMGVALFSNALQPGGDSARFAAESDGTLRMYAASAPVSLQPGESTEWSARIFCFAENLPARAIQDSYLGYLGGRSW